MFFELLKEESRAYNLAYFQKDSKSFAKTRLLYGIGGLLIGTMLWWVMQSFSYLLAIPIGFIIGYKFPYYDVLVKKAAADKLNMYAFPEFLGSFIALIPSTGNVYQTLVAALPYTKEPLRSALQQLIENVWLDNKREHYMAFAEYVGTSEANMIMDTIYQFSEFGRKKESLQELSNFAQELEKNAQSEMITKKMNDMEYLGYLPIFLSILFILAFVGVMLVEFFAPIMNAF